MMSGESAMVLNHMTNGATQRLAWHIRTKQHAGGIGKDTANKPKGVE